MNSITFAGFTVAVPAARAAVAVAGTCPRGVVSAQFAQAGPGLAAAGSALPVEVVVARPRMQLQKYPFMTHGAAINGAKLGPHRAWDPV